MFCGISQDQKLRTDHCITRNRQRRGSGPTLRRLSLRGMTNTVESACGAHRPAHDRKTQPALPRNDQARASAHVPSSRCRGGVPLDGSANTGDRAESIEYAGSLDSLPWSLLLEGTQTHVSNVSSAATMARIERSCSCTSGLQRRFRCSAWSSPVLRRACCRTDEGLIKGPFISGWKAARGMATQDASGFQMVEIGAHGCS
jgi:hypothetical protein